MYIEVQNLTKIYGVQKAVNDLSFTVNKGEIVGFLGPNGAGKSTTMKMLTCFTQPTLGNAKVCGHDVVEEPMEVKKKIGYLPEHNPMYLEMYVKEYLQFVANMYNLGSKKAKRVADLIDMLGLGVEQKKQLGALSKGFRQRVGLAQALMNDPDVLILDEPTSGFDPSQVQEIRKIILELGKQKTILLSTHIMQEVQHMCNRVLIIHHGKLVADSTIGQLETEHKLSVKFKKSMETRQLAALKSVASVENIPAGYRLSGKNSVAMAEEVFALAVASGNPILSMVPEQIDLEMVFKNLTGMKDFNSQQTI